MSGRRFVPALMLIAAGASACGSGGSNPLNPTDAVALARSNGRSTTSNGANAGQSVLQGQWGDTKKASCSPSMPTTRTASIGPSGGTLKIGPHTLDVPAGALATTVTISGSITADSVGSVQLLPEGLQFSVPVQLTMSYKHCSVGNDPAKTMKVAYTSDDLVQLLALLPSKDVKSIKSVIGTLNHFSRYAIAY